MRKVKYPEIGSRIRQARINAGLKQKDCLEPLGDITPQMLSDWENGYVCPSITYLGNISKFYKVSLDYIILGKQKEEKDKTIRTYKDAAVYITELINCELFDMEGYCDGNNKITNLLSKDRTINKFKNEFDNLLIAKKSMKDELYKQAIVDLLDRYDYPLEK